MKIVGFLVDVSRSQDGREIANALVGHRLTDEEIEQMLDEGWGDALVGKRAVADVEWAELADGTQRLRLPRRKPKVKKPPREPAATGGRRGPGPRPVDDKPEMPF